MSFQQYRRCINCLTTDYGEEHRNWCQSCGFPFDGHIQISSSSSRQSPPPTVATSSSQSPSLSSGSRIRSSLKRPRGESEAGVAMDIEVGDIVAEEVVYCEICKKGFYGKKEAYTLEFCQHGFCRTCLVGHVARHAQLLSLHQIHQLGTNEGSFEGIPCPVCTLALSRQDIRLAAGAKTLNLFDGLVVDLVTRRYNSCLESSCPSCVSATEKATLMKAEKLPELRSMEIREALMTRNLPFSGSKTDCLQRLQSAFAAYPVSLLFCLSCDFIRCENCGDIIKDHPKSASLSSPSTHQCQSSHNIMLSLFRCLARLDKSASKTGDEKMVGTPTNHSNRANISGKSKSVHIVSKSKLKAALDYLAKQKAKAKVMSVETEPSMPSQIVKSNWFSHELKKSVNNPLAPTPPPTVIKTSNRAQNFLLSHQLEQSIQLPPTPTPNPNPIVRQARISTLIPTPNFFHSQQLSKSNTFPSNPAPISIPDFLLVQQLKKSNILPSIPNPNPTPTLTPTSYYPTQTLHYPLNHSLAPPGYIRAPYSFPLPFPAYNQGAVMPTHAIPHSLSTMKYFPTQTDKEDMTEIQSMDKEFISGNGEKYTYYPVQPNLTGNLTTSSADDETLYYPTVPMPQMQWPKKLAKKKEPMPRKDRISALNLEKAADAEIKQIFEELIVIISLFPPNPEKLPCHAVSLICGHKAVMRVIGELVRNDSILDVCDRSTLYFALFSLLQAFASRKELLPFLCHPYLSNSTINDVWMQKQRWKLVGSLAGDFRKLYKQMKGLLRQSSYLMACNDDVGTMEATLLTVGTSTYKELRNSIQVWEKTSKHIWCEDADAYFQKFGLWDSLSGDLSDVGDSKLSLIAGGLPQTSNDPGTKGVGLAGIGELIYTPSSEEVKAYKTALQPLQHGCISLSESHYFRNEGNAGNWRVSSIRHVSKEIAVLSTNLPLEWESSIFLRFDDSRMDLLKVLIIGPQNTPYMNGVFLFDMLLSKNYPDTPPLMIFLTTGGGSVRFNPNLYENGKVCLSLLGTWTGPSWVPGQSTILQVLISIQSLVFVADPYSNEPGRENWTIENSTEAMIYMKKQQYNTVKYSMLPALRNPEPIFKDVIHTHFRIKREEIICQCAKWATGYPRILCPAEEVQTELQKL